MEKSVILHCRLLCAIGVLFSDQCIAYSESWKFGECLSF